MPSAHWEQHLQSSITLAAVEVGYSSRRLSGEGLVSTTGLLPVLLETPLPVFWGSHAALTEPTAQLCCCQNS